MDKKQNLNYEELYERLLDRGTALHSSNRKRIRIGLIFLAVFSVAMILIRWLTDSDRVVFLVIWVIGMFAISIYLIGIEYIDNSVQKTLEEVTERETEFGELLPDSEEVRERVREKIQERQEEIQSRYQGLRITSGRSRSEGDADDAETAVADPEGTEPVDPADAEVVALDEGAANGPAAEEGGAE